MRRLVLILSFFIVFVSYSYSQTEHLPQVAWRTILKNVVMVNDSTYTVEVDPIDYNEPGAIQRIIGNYLKDFVGHTYKVIDSTSTTITVVDVFQTGVGPQTDRAAVVYRSVGDGLSPYLAPIYYNYLDKSAFDYSRSIELSVLWEVGAAYVKDSADILWWKDTLIHVATKYDIDTLRFLRVETDPIYSNDSANIVWFSDIDTLSFLRTETDPVYSNDSSSIIWFSDTISIISTKYDLDTLNFLREETHKERGYSTGLSSRTVTVTFDVPFDNVPIGLSNLKVYRWQQVVAGKWRARDVQYYFTTSGSLTNTGFSLEIETTESLTGVIIEYLFFERFL